MFFLNISASSPTWAHSSIVLNGTCVVGGHMANSGQWIVKGNAVFHFWDGHLLVDLKTYSVSFLFPFRKIINNVQHMDSFLNLGSLNKNDGYEKTKPLGFKSLRFGS